jgi:hypothetical protein
MEIERKGETNARSSAGGSQGILAHVPDTHLVDRDGRAPAAA